MPVLALLILLLSSLSAQSQGLAETLTVERRAYASWISLDAHIEAVQQATISAQTSGRIQHIHVDVNDYVQQGQLLIELRNQQQKAAVQQAQAGLKQAKANLEERQSKFQQAQDLLAQGSLSQGAFDTSNANLKAAAAAVEANMALLKQAQEQLSYSQIKAPYAGIVQKRLVQVGESVQPGTALMSGLSLNALRAVAQIPQRLIHQVKDIQQASDIIMVHDGQHYPGQSLTLFPFAEAQSHSFKLRVDINTQDHTHTPQALFPGMWVKLRLPMPAQNAIHIPSSALIIRGELTAVYVTSPQGPLLRQIRPGAKVDDKHVEVLAGLKPGEQIYVDGYGQLQALQARGQ